MALKQHRREERRCSGFRRLGEHSQRRCLLRWRAETMFWIKAEGGSLSWAEAWEVMARAGHGKGPVRPDFEAGASVVGRWDRGEEVWKASLEPEEVCFFWIQRSEASSGPWRDWYCSVIIKTGIAWEKNWKTWGTKALQGQSSLAVPHLPPLSPHLPASLCWPPHSPLVPGRPVASASSSVGDCSPLV